MEVIVEPINCDMYMANIFQLNTKIIATVNSGYPGGRGVIPALSFFIKFFGLKQRALKKKLL